MYLLQLKMYKLLYYCLAEGRMAQNVLLISKSPIESSIIRDFGCSPI